MLEAWGVLKLTRCQPLLVNTVSHVLRAVTDGRSNRVRKDQLALRLEVRGCPLSDPDVSVTVTRTSLCCLPQLRRRG